MPAVDLARYGLMTNYRVGSGLPVSWAPRRSKMASTERTTRKRRRCPALSGPQVLAPLRYPQGPQLPAYSYMDTADRSKTARDGDG